MDPVGHPRVFHGQFTKGTFCVKVALFRGKGGPPVLEEPARHRTRQGRFFFNPADRQGIT